MAMTPEQAAVRSYRRQFALPPDPLRVGGQAEIFLAEIKETGEEVILKRVRDNLRETRKRMRREIEIQLALDHPNTMPILSHSPDYSCYTMPIADMVLDEMLMLMPNGMLEKVVRACVAGLDAAHSRGVYHRDLSPANIMALGSGSKRRWVIGDWGFVSRPPGPTVTRLTRSGVAYGTAGFAAPELFDNAHRVDGRADIYSLGRIIACAATEVWPSPNTPLIPSNRWRAFVEATTAPEPVDRPQHVAQLLPLLDAAMALESSGAEEEVATLLLRVEGGDSSAVPALIGVAAGHPNDAGVWFDQIARMESASVSELARAAPGDAYRAVQILRRLLMVERRWGNRDFNDVNLPLSWIHSVAQAAAENNNSRLLRYSSECLFACEPLWHRYAQRTSTRRWLVALREWAAIEVASALRNYPEAVAWYRAEGWEPKGADEAIRSALEVVI